MSRSSITIGAERPRRPRAHPGELIRDELAARGLSATKLALALGVNPNRITEIVQGRRAITPDTAFRLALLWGGEPGFWLGLQAQHDLSVLEATRGEEIRSQVRGGEPRPIL